MAMQAQTTVTEPVKIVQSAAQIKYAPSVTPVAGAYNLYCIALVWKDNPGPKVSKLASAGHTTAYIYNQLSNGKLNYKIIPKIVKVDFTHDQKNLAAAELQAKNSIKLNPEDKNNIFVFAHNEVQGFSYDNKDDIVHLHNTAFNVLSHEVGHCKPLFLGHSGKYTNGTYDPLGDDSTLMGVYPSRALTASQLYFLGWLPQNKVAQFDPATISMDYKIEKLSSKKANECVKAVLIPKDQKTSLFVSMPKVNKKFIFALHLAEGGQSQLLTTFDKTAEYENLQFERVESKNGCTTLRITNKTFK